MDRNFDGNEGCRIQIVMIGVFLKSLTDVKDIGLCLIRHQTTQANKKVGN
jgi:hypothetical protein